MEKRPRVWVTGAKGLIGGYILRAASEFAPQFDVIGLDRGEMDILDFAAVEQRFKSENPNLIIHCAAMSRVVDCQADPVKAREINVDATSHLASLAQDRGFIFFSTDLVYDGRKGNYVETDAPNPLSFYGETKAAAEQAVTRSPGHIVLRASLNYGFSSGMHLSFNQEMEAAWREGKAVKLFVDEFRCVIPAAVTARVVWELAKNTRGGIYHLAGSERLSRLEIGNLIAARCPQPNPKIEPSSIRDYRGPQRPADLSLNCAKLQQRLSFELPSFAKWLESNQEN
jgi:dTDP-4-dehydrorhamnose reductase